LNLDLTKGNPRQTAINKGLPRVTLGLELGKPLTEGSQNIVADARCFEAKEKSLACVRTLRGIPSARKRWCWGQFLRRR